MSSEYEQISIAIIGVRFGAEFVPIYQKHPNIREVILCDRDTERLNEVGDRFQIRRRFADLESVLNESDIDAVHLLTPFPLHAAQTLEILQAGKHCASAVCMGSTIDELCRIIDAQKSSGKNYMMMETTVYAREYLWVKNLHDRGELGDLTFLRGVYFQDAEGYPDYWKSIPPMHYATHAVAPLLALAQTRAVHVHCLGSGRLSPRLQQPNANPFRAQTAIFRLEKSDAAMEVTRSWFETARPYIEGFHVYGSQRGFEWNALWDEKPLLFTLEDEARLYGGRPVGAERVEIGDFADRLPESLRPFTQFANNGAHGGSHPHLVHEFVQSIVEKRKPTIDAITAANWTAPGICAHESALQDGERVEVPRFDT